MPNSTLQVIGKVSTCRMQARHSLGNAERPSDATSLLIFQGQNETFDCDVQETVQILLNITLSLVPGIPVTNNTSS